VFLFTNNKQKQKQKQTQTTIMVPIFFLDGTEKTVAIDSFTTCQDVCDDILNMVGIDTIHLKEFTLYEVSGEYGTKEV
jgi:hypothetical protein